MQSSGKHNTTYQILIGREGHVFHWHIETFRDLAFKRLDSGALGNLDAFQSISEEVSKRKRSHKGPAGASVLTLVCACVLTWISI